MVWDLQSFVPGLMLVREWWDWESCEFGQEEWHDGGLEDRCLVLEVLGQAVWVLGVGIYGGGVHVYIKMSNMRYERRPWPLDRLKAAE